MVKNALMLAGVIGIVGAALAGCCSPAQPTKPAAPAEGQTLLLATTTSTENSGLLAYLLPGFETEHGAKIDVVAVGTGQALKKGEEGNADVLLVHARAREDACLVLRLGGQWAHRRSAGQHRFARGWWRSNHCSSALP